MTRRWLRGVAAASLTVVALAALSMPVAAAGGYDSVTEALIRNLHWKLLAIAVPLGLLVEGVLFYAAVRFHGNEDPEPTADNRRLEVAWTLGVAVVLLFVGASSYMVLAQPMTSTTPGAAPQAGDVQVRVTGQNWFWSFSYPEENVTSRNELVLPTNRTVFLTVTSKDVIHSVHVPGLGIKQDAIPGRENTYRTRLTDTGTYRLYCAEFCGAGHSTMTATVRVVSPEAYRAWLDERRNASGAQNGTSTATLRDGRLVAAGGATAP